MGPSLPGMQGEKHSCGRRLCKAKPRIRLYTGRRDGIYRACRIRRAIADSIPGEGAGNPALACGLSAVANRA